MLKLLERDSFPLRELAPRDLDIARKLGALHPRLPFGEQFLALFVFGDVHDDGRGAAVLRDEQRTMRALRPFAAFAQVATIFRERNDILAHFRPR